jgi:hypothetical protein
MSNSTRNATPVPVVAEVAASAAIAVSDEPPVEPKRILKSLTLAAVAVQAP